MKIGPLFKWFGSKWQSAKHYPVPEHSRIFEPFAGGAGYSLNYCDRQVTLEEKDPNLLALWFWLINEATEATIRAIPVGLPVGTDIHKLELSTGQALLLKHWQRTNNVGDCTTISPWGDKPGQWTESTRSRVAEQHQAVRHWQILGVTTYAVEYPATVFVDPPYQYNYRYRASLPEISYTTLGARCRQLVDHGCQVIVCEALGKNGERPAWLPFRDSHSSVTSRRKETQSHHSREMIWP